MKQTYGKIGTVTIDKDLSNQFGQELDAGELTELNAGLSELTDKAYNLGDPTALREAEMLLFRLNLACNFTHPLQAKPGLVWSQITRQKLRTALANNAEPLKELSGDELTEALRVETTKSTQAAEKLVDAVLDKDDDGTALRVFTKNWFVPGQGFIEWMVSIAHRTTDPTLRKTITENIQDEIEGEGHKVMRDRFCQAVGVEFNLDALLKDDEVCTETLSKANFRIVINALDEVAYPLGSLYSIEAHTGPLSAQMTKRLKERGFDEKSIETFSTHAGVDAEHAEEWLQAVLGAKSIDKVGRGKVLLGTQMQYSHRLRWMQGIARTAKLSVSL